MSAATFVVFLAVTGIAMNHEDGFGLTEVTVESRLLLAWYDVAPKSEPIAFRIGETGRWAVGLERGVYLGDTFFPIDDPPMMGATALGRMILLASKESLLLVTASDKPALIERLDSASLPGTIRRLGLEHGHDDETADAIVVETDQGIFRADAELVVWQRITDPIVVWSRAEVPPGAVLQQALESFRGRGLPLSRVIADVHSGRILGRFGPLLMDAAAVALLVLAGTGFYMVRAMRRQPPPGGGLSI